jgi:formate dehydrogenase subunit delta
LNVEHLVRMANQIGDFFAAESEDQTLVTDVANHLQRFWEPRMRKRLIEYVQSGGTGLHAHVADAVRSLATPAG